MTAAAAPESILACADAAADEAADDAAGVAAVADMLAAMAAAAIANGAVAVPEVGGAGGAAAASVTATVMGIAVAMAFIAVAAACCAEAAASVEEPLAEVSPDDDFAADFAVSDFELPDFAWDGGAALALVPAFALVGGAAEAFWLVESLLTDGAAAAPFCDPPLFAAGGALSERDCEAGCGGAVAAELLASLLVLLSTSAPKIPLPELASDLAARGGALWKGTFVAASDVTLYTGGLSQWFQPMISKDRATPLSIKYCGISVSYEDIPGRIRGSGKVPFCLAARFAVRGCKRVERDCLTGMRPILKNSFSAALANPLSRECSKAS